MWIISLITLEIKGASFIKRKDTIIKQMQLCCYVYESHDNRTEEALTLFLFLWTAVWIALSGTMCCKHCTIFWYFFKIFLFKYFFVPVINCAGSLWSSGRRIYAVTEQGESDQPRQIKTQPDNSSRTEPVPSSLFLLLHFPLTNERELASQREFATNNDEKDKIRLHPENIPPSAEYPANIPGHLVGFCGQAE